MEMRLKVCTRCGRRLPEENFRLYYNRDNGARYTFCNECERIEARRKYLVGRGNKLTKEQVSELFSIDELYRRRAAAGLKVPCSRKSKGSVGELVGKLLEGDYNEDM